MRMKTDNLIMYCKQEGEIIMKNVSPVSFHCNGYEVCFFAFFRIEKQKLFSSIFRGAPLHEHFHVRRPLVEVFNLNYTSQTIFCRGRTFLKKRHFFI